MDPMDDGGRFNLPLDRRRPSPPSSIVPLIHRPNPLPSTATARRDGIHCREAEGSCGERMVEVVGGERVDDAAHERRRWLPPMRPIPREISAQARKHEGGEEGSGCRGGRSGSGRAVAGDGSQPGSEHKGVQIEGFAPSGWEWEVSVVGVGVQIQEGLPDPPGVPDMLPGVTASGTCVPQVGRQQPLVKVRMVCDRRDEPVRNAKTSTQVPTLLGGPFDQASMW